MSEQPKTVRIDELTQKLSELKEQKNKLNTEARELAEKRNKLNEQHKNLRSQILELKNERDKLNEKVKQLKQQREKTRKEIQEKIEEISKLNQEIRVFVRKKPSRDSQILQKQVESIEWKIQTTSLSLQEEKELIEQVKQLEAQLNIHRKLDNLKQKTFELKAEIKGLETNLKLFHEKQTGTAQKSQQIHEKMLAKIDESKKLKKEADSLHQLFLQAKERAKPIQEEFFKISNQVESLRKEIRIEEEEDKKKNEEALREKLEKQARERLKRGEKLTWEEFQLLAEKGMGAQD